MMEYSIHRAANTSLPYDDNYILMYLEQLRVLLVIGMTITTMMMKERPVTGQRTSDGKF